MLRATLLSLSLSLGGCAKPLVVHDSVEVPIVHYEAVPVPEALLTPCRVVLELETNQDLEAALAASIIELKRCTSDKEAIRGLGREEVPR